MLVEKFQRLVLRYTRIRNKKYYNIIKDHLTNVLCILHVGKNVWVKLEKKIIISCNFGTLLFYTLISSNTTLRYMFAQGFLESHLELTSNMCLYSNLTYMYMPLSYP